VYQNLVRSVDAGAHESVHLAEYPDTDVDAIDEALSRQVRLAMRVSSLGRAARSKAGLKVRQPLGRVLVRTRTPEEAADLDLLGDQIADELNVLQVAPLAATESVADARVAFNAKTYGSAFGRDVPELVQAVAALSPADVQSAVEQVTVGRWQVPRAALTVEYQARPGYAVAHEAGYLVALETAITPELAAAGLARELVHRLQTMRKNAGFEIADSIDTYYQGDDEVRRVLTEHAEYVRQETLSRRLEEGEGPADAYREEQEIDGHGVWLWVRRIV
jgi:isoleucyl-tRNA synthetase